MCSPICILRIRKEDGLATENAIKVYDALPAPGEKISGGKVKEATGLNTTELKAAKAELKEAGLVTLGQGRGGTIIKVEGQDIERPVKKTKEEALELAREAKVEKSRAEQARDALRARIIEVGKRMFPDADEILPGQYEDRYYVQVWKDKKSGMKYLDPDDLL
jgi:DNA-binding IscR family transcriptional regulator